MKLFDPLDPPKNWCLVSNSKDENFCIFAKWSSSHYAWIGLGLLPVKSLEKNDMYEETKFRTLYQLNESLV
jgi:hypothetical protein